MTQEALKLALECAERCEEIDGMYSWSATITAIKEALAQTQEPLIGCVNHDCDKCKAQTQEPVAHWSDCAVHNEPAYPKGECDCGGFPPQRTWVGLTNNELQPIADEYRILFGGWVEDFARAIEAKLKQKNGYAEEKNT